jgi:hypothetical protein
MQALFPIFHTYGKLITKEDIRIARVSWEMVSTRTHNTEQKDLMFQRQKLFYDYFYSYLNGALDREDAKLFLNVPPAFGNAYIDRKVKEILGVIFKSYSKPMELESYFIKEALQNCFSGIKTEMYKRVAEAFMKALEATLQLDFSKRIHNVWAKILSFVVATIFQPALTAERLVPTAGNSVQQPPRQQLRSALKRSKSVGTELMQESSYHSSALSGYHNESMESLTARSSYVY